MHPCSWRISSSLLEQVETYTRGLDEEEFLRDVRTQDAVIRRFEIIGEAVKALPEDLKSQEENIRWRDIAGLRDVLIHGYHRVNLHRLWIVIEEDLEWLREAILNMLAEL